MLILVGTWSRTLLQILWRNKGPSCLFKLGYSWSLGIVGGTTHITMENGWLSKSILGLIGSYLLGRWGKIGYELCLAYLLFSCFPTAGIFFMNTLRGEVEEGWRMLTQQLHVKGPSCHHGGPFYGVHCCPKFLAVFTQFVRRRPNFWAFLCSFTHCRLKNWISVSDQITRSRAFSMYVDYITVANLYNDQIQKLLS